MKKNESKTERIIRFIIGLLILAAGYYFQTWWGLIGLIPLITSLTGNCPIYSILGINKCSKK